MKVALPTVALAIFAPMLFVNSHDGDNGPSLALPRLADVNDNDGGESMRGSLFVALV
jgi:hypothetical protein